MNKRQWRTAKHPKAMLEFLRGTGRASHRKLRLFMAACCRRVIHTFDEDDDWGREEAIDVAERYADGLASEEEREDALGDLTDGNPVNLWDHCTNLAVVDFTQESPDDADAVACAIGAAEEACISAHTEPYDQTEAIDKAERAAQADLLRDIFGPLPFRPVAIAPSLLGWNDGLVVRMANAIYEERSLPAGTLDGARLAVLADALEEAGCSDAELLAHLRGPGPHVRGCWVVDLLVTKE